MKIKPKKSLGQNFLIDQDVVQKIIIGADLRPNDVVLEIGPGKGVLTEALAAKCRKVIAVEIDQALIPVLKKRFEGNKKIEIIHGDALNMDISKIVPCYKLVANIPYYITSLIIRRFLESDVPPEEMILMVQKEVAERIVSKPGKMSILAVSVQYYATAELLFSVPKTAFDPVPEVDSAVLKIFNFQFSISNSDRNNFFRIVRAGFCAKRKTLANNLANSLHIPRSEAENKLAQVEIASNARAQELSVEDWKKLAELF